MQSVKDGAPEMTLLRCSGMGNVYQPCLHSPERALCTGCACAPPNGIEPFRGHLSAQSGVKQFSEPGSGTAVKIGT